MSGGPPLNIAFVSSEVAPLAKTGGLADVAAALPRYLVRTGHDVRVILPLYRTIDTASLELHAVDFLQDLELPLGRGYRYRVLTTRLPGTEHGMYLVDCPALYDRASIYTADGDEHLRFAALSRAAIECCQRMGFRPDVFHCNDWHTGLIPLYLKTLYEWDRLFGATRTVLTIHNLGYQGIFPATTAGELGLAGRERLLDRDDLHAGRFGYLKTGILYADVLTTVSPTYAREIQEEAHGMGLHPMLRARAGSLVGILNGIDYGEWDPAGDSWIACRYSTSNLSAKGRNKRALMNDLHLDYQPSAPVLGVISRLTPQKGFELAFDVLPEVLSRVDLRVAVLGSGERHYEEFFTRLQAAFPGRVCFYRGYSNALAHRIEAGSDMFLMPSRYEPCGLNQMFSLRYGTVPIVRKTGGLADTVEPFDPATGTGTGFVFEHFTSDGLRWALGRALETYRDRKAWRRLMRNGMAQDFSWDVQGPRYVELYRRITGT